MSGALRENTLERVENRIPELEGLLDNIRLEAPGESLQGGLELGIPGLYNTLNNVQGASREDELLLGGVGNKIPELQDTHQQKFRLHHMRQPCILTQATSHLHPERPEHPDAGYAPWLHPVLGHHPP